MVGRKPGRYFAWYDGQILAFTYHKEGDWSYDGIRIDPSEFTLIPSALELRAQADCLAEKQRLFDLVRHQRHALHQAGLISNEEFAEILVEGSGPDGSVKRLESYDGVWLRLDATTLERDQLRAFASEIWGAHTGSLDGCDIEELAEKHGLVTRVDVTEPCGESCGCAEFGFPLECLRKTRVLGGQNEA